MASIDEQVEKLFNKLDTQLRSHQTKRALKTADEVLKLSPGDAEATGCKVALLIDLGNVGAALQLIDGSPALAPRLAFEKAYCAYRLGRLQDALHALRAVGPDCKAARLQLEAQLQYRLGNHAEAISLYTELFREHAAEAKDAQANLLAAYVASGRAAEVPAVMSAWRIAPRASFEVAFNAACGLVAEGKLTEAESQLHVAQKVGEETLYEEEMEEEEVAAELAPVAAQLAYVAAVRGQWAQALRALQAVLALSAGGASDDATTATATGNLCAALLRLHPADRKSAAEGLRKLEPFLESAGGARSLQPALASRLAPAHAEALLRAYASAALAAGKADAAREAVRGMEAHFPACPALPLLRASLLARDNKVREAAAALEGAAAALGGSPDAQLMRAQLAAAGGDAAAAAALLGDLPAAVGGRPAVVATRAALLEQQGDVAAAATVLTGALGGGGGSDGATATRWVRRRLASLEVARGELERAAQQLRALLDADATALEDPDLLELLPRLVALDDPEAAGVLLERLPPPPALPAAELDALEAGGVSATASQRRAHAAGFKPVSSLPGAAAGAAADSGEAAAKRTVKKRKRKPRLPKGFDPANPGPPLDPERWLPKWQRSDAKKAAKKRRNKSEVIKGSQGAGVVDSSLDKSGAMEGQPAAAAQPPRPPPGGKKKGKGRR